MDREIFAQITSFIDRYLEMKILGIKINCPYWMNKIKDGKVFLRGFADGKGSADEIREELINRLNNLSTNSRFELTPDSLRKFARRERMGIDCSGFVYRVLEELIRLKYMSCSVSDLSNTFPGGINGTNADSLTKKEVTVPVLSCANFRTGDLIRMMGGKHILVIIKVNAERIEYAHSSFLRTQVQGVHTKTIRIIDSLEPLQYQDWLEKTRQGENFGKKYFHPEKGDGVYRLKIFSCR